MAADIFSYSMNFFRGALSSLLLLRVLLHETAPSLPRPQCTRKLYEFPSMTSWTARPSRPSSTFVPGE
eukprot:7441540-Pyramimonas_sp.AAC.1